MNYHYPACLNEARSN